MAYATPATFSAGQLVLASDLNAIQTNVTALRAGEIALSSQATHDLAVATGANTWARLAPGTSGHFLKTNSTGSAPAWAAVAVESDIGIVEGRLTASSGVPVTIADVSGAANIYFTPYAGNRIALYDGSSAWEVKTFTEITISLSGFTAIKPYDVFAYNNSGTVAIETLIWTNNTTRATALAYQDGVLVKSGATTRRYLGTVYINAAGGQTEDTILKRYVWNYYNRHSRNLRVMDTTNSWTYTTGTVRQMRGSTANQVDVVVGVAEVPVALSLRIGAQNSGVGVNMWAGIGHNSVGVPVTTSQSSYSTSPVAYHVQTLGAGLTIYPAIGFSYFPMLEWSSAAGTTTWYGNNTASTPTRSGMSGWIEG